MSSFTVTGNKIISICVRSDNTESFATSRHSAAAAASERMNEWTGTFSGRTRPRERESTIG